MIVRKLLPRPEWSLVDQLMYEALASEFDKKPVD
jgi:hypothetical protein